MVTTTLQTLAVYRCAICGNVVELVHVGGGTLVCCGHPMTQLVENTVDASREKHLPVVEKTETGIRVQVGSIAHPMEEKHYIEWIEVVADGRVSRQSLVPGAAPEATFPITSGELTVRALCNLHGLWKVEVTV